MSDHVTSFFVLVPGPWRQSGEVLECLARSGLSATPCSEAPLHPGEIRVQLVEDDGLAEAFDWGRRGPLPDELVVKVGACRRAALLEVAGTPLDAPARLAELGRALRDAGGMAIRVESSGAASPWEPWLAHLDSGLPERLYYSSVSIVADDDGAFFTCGMHVFNLPDARIATADSEESVRWLDELCVFQIAESPLLGSGHTFHPEADSPRRQLVRWPDGVHRPDDGRHNPFGVWHVLPVGAAGLEVGALIPTLVPSLVVTLTAAERDRDRALTKPELENIVQNSAAVMMSLADVRALELSRGYADIEPELAWEQWPLARGLL